MKKLSIIIPIYNAEAWLSETLDSLVNQTYANIEIICVDDGSKDKSCEVIKTYKEKYPQIVLIQQKNAGVCVARNNGIENASGNYIAFIDADDYVELDMYEKLIIQLEEESSDIIFCEFTRFWSDGHTLKTIENSFKKLVSNPQDIKYFIYSTDGRREGDILYTNDIHGTVCRSIFKKDILNNYNIRFKTDLKFAEDQVFVLEYLEHCKKVSYTERSYVWYRGWTKERRYGKIYANQMALAGYQEAIINRNHFYSDDVKKRISAYVKCSTYFAIVNDEFSLNPDCVRKMKEYSKNKRFNSLLNLETFKQKYNIKPEPKRIILFVLLKLRMWNVVKSIYPNKYY